MTDVIDIVIPWVDGDDPVHRAERQKDLHSHRQTGSAS
ncbi:MAG: Stealth CR1 domain-containing protein [Bacteroidales bacterium]|nr:Stealth CR1 domain-containing protein [Bacteroidales bacterium]